MSSADASEVARHAARVRWGSQVPEKAAEVVLERMDELPPTVRAELHLKTADPKGHGDDV